MLQRERQSRQYMTSWERLEKLAVPILLALLIIAGLIGWLEWVRRDPENAATACVRSLQGGVKSAVQSWLQNTTGLNVVPPG